MNVHDVVATTAQNIAQLLLEIEADREARVRSVEINWLTASDPDDVRIFYAALDVRSDDVDVMAETPGLSREEMHVLADSAEVRIVVLGDECDAKRA